MIDERTQDQAALYVLGALNDAEANEFRRSMQSNPELAEFVAGLTKSADALAGAVPQVQPPPQLRAKILAQIAPAQKTISLPERKPNWIAIILTPLTIALAILLTIEFKENSSMQGANRKQENRIASLTQLTQTLLTTSNDLRQTVTALQETNRLVNLRIAMLNSLMADAPKTVAVTLWDNEKQSGVFVGENLKMLPSNRDYELWVLDDSQKPVAAGVFHVDKDGKVRMEFKPSRLIKTAGKFAVTEEVKGGVDSPTLTNLVLAGD